MWPALSERLKTPALVDMKNVKVESYIVEGGTDRASPFGGGGVAGSINRWWMLMTGKVVRVTT
jgi:hypothetical protein